MRLLSRIAVILIGAAVLLGIVQWSSPAPAAASCVLPPQVSTNPFVGTVIGVSNAGRTATVRTDDGRTVVVQGSPSDRPGGVTTVDRTYQVGVRYEFHPVNDADPYQDNACTATHPIDSTRGPASSPTAAVVGGPQRSTNAEGTGLNGPLVAGGVAVTAVLATGLGLWLFRRRR